MYSQDNRFRGQGGQWDDCFGLHVMTSNLNIYLFIPPPTDSHHTSKPINHNMWSTFILFTCNNNENGLITSFFPGLYETFGGNMMHSTLIWHFIVLIGTVSPKCWGMTQIVLSLSSWFHISNDFFFFNWYQRVGQSFEKTWKVQRPQMKK